LSLLLFIAIYNNNVYNSEMVDRARLSTPSEAILKLANTYPKQFLEALKRDDPLSATVTRILLDATMEETILELTEESEIEP